MASRQTARIFILGLFMVTLSVPVCAGTNISGEQFQHGWLAYQDGEYAAALGFWGPLVVLGDANAQLNVGLMYDSGQGVGVDPAKAVELYRQAANDGLAAAQYNLSMMYAAGRGVEQDDDMAKYWLEQAAAQGLQNARAMLSDFPDLSGVSRARPADGERSYIIDILNGAATGTAWPVAMNYAVTSNHVVSDVDRVTLYDAAGLPLSATVVLRDVESDLALLRTREEGSLPPALPLSRAPGRLGSDVFTLGFPRVDILGRTPKLSDGIISSINGYRDNPANYQTSVQIQPGNSGGPLLNMAGEVVGIVASMLGTVSDNAEPVAMPNISYAVKVERLQKLLEALPERARAANGPGGRPAPLADLAERIQSSLLLVVTAE